MSLLEFARGPGLAFALVVFFAGTAWRLFGIFRRPARVDHSLPRRTPTARDALAAIWVRMFPRREYGSPRLGSTVNAYAYHVGLLLVVATFAPHIAFVERLTGLRWPALPDVVAYVATAAAILGLVVALVHRTTDAVLRRLSNFDDWFTWVVVMAPLVTGMALIDHQYVPAPPHPQPGMVSPGLLALHLITLEVMLVWFPFGKLMHAVLAFVSRGRTGMALARKGAAQ